MSLTKRGGAWLYLIMIAGTVGLFFAVRALGEGLVAPSPHPGAIAFGKAAGKPAAHTLQHLLLSLGVVIAVARAFGALFHRFGQPRVVGEVVAGIALGPSLLGRIWPEATAFVLPPDVVPSLGMLSQVGVLLYMFLVGLELDLGSLTRRTHAAVAISHASIVAPFGLGMLLALGLFPRLGSSDVPFPTFVLFIGISLSVTAFPVLARILTDRGLTRTDLGVMALTCAAADDVTAWCLLALVMGVAEQEPTRVVTTLVLTVAYIAVALLIARPFVARLVARVGDRPLSASGLAIVCVALLFSSVITEWIGVHAIFGAFLAGAVIPHDSALAKDVVKRLEDLVVVFFLPAFFAFTGLRTQIGLVSGATEWALCGVIILVASAGKFGGTLLAARFTGLGWRESASLGALMNTRGLMELVVLNVGLDLGVIGPRLFAMMVLMALVTTFATTPVLNLLMRGKSTVASGVPA